jgi:uncharacterized protein YggU (UPF0235/DUF167 family)
MTAGDESTVLTVRVHPRSSKNRHLVDADQILHVWVTAPAVEGAANMAVSRYLADVLEISRSRISLVSGETARTKRVRVDLPAGSVMRRLKVDTQGK